ncbi:isoprenyl transferase [bacterium]|nr:isoprenyl transferase [bacterium]
MEEFTNKIKHVAIIMDGNRRWAKEKKLPTMMGHKKGVEALKKTVIACEKFGVKYLTVYAFSTENWNRTKEEVDFLMNLLAQTITGELLELHKNNVVLNFIGDLEALSQDLQKALKNAHEKTKNNTGVNLQVAINYGGRDEIKNAIKKIVASGISEEEITEELISKNLYKGEIPDPDLVIRTGNEKRISNFLLWQIAYSELYVTDIFWPDFDENELKKAIEEFNLRTRRFGE